jgi:serine/threonine-protein kinase
MTDAAAWERIEACLDELLALPAGERAAALERLAGGDAALRLRLQGLLDQTSAGDSLLDRPALAAFQSEATPAGSVAPGTRIGAWRVVELIGRGGMGEVYRAERADGQFEQQAALKLIRRDAAESPRRFQAERQILARLEHSGIARLLDGGVAQDGRPYMAMELVSGSSITEWCCAADVSLEQRLALIMAVCEAVAYAHRNLIIHRDLKPGNVMVTREGAVKLLDFGIAKLLAADGAEEQTRHTPVTLGYAAPEQLAGGAVTTATDVYALGILLFEVLTGRRPWSLAELPMASALDKLLRDSLPAPSRHAAELAVSPVPAKLLRGDLDAIVAKAVRREPERRYASADALREDIARHLRGEPVAARAGARLYEAGRFLKRNRLFAASGALVLLAIVAGSLGMAWQARRAQIEARKATAVKDFVIGIFNANGLDNPDGAKARATTAEQLLDLGARRIGTDMQDVPEVRAELLGTIGGLYADLDLSERAIGLLQEQVDLLKRLRGEGADAQVAEAEVKLGAAQVNAGHYSDAGDSLTAALRILDALHDRDSVTRARALTWLAHIAFKQRPFKDPAAEQFAKESLHILETRHPEETLRITDISELARICLRRKDYAAAEDYYHEALALEQGPPFNMRPSDIAGIQLEYGEMLLRARRYDEAAEKLGNALDLYRKQVGGEYAQAIRAQEYLAVVALERGHLSEARPILAQALQSFVRVRGADDLVWTADARVWYARLLLARGEMETAETMVDESVSSFRAHAPNSVFLPLVRRVQADLFVAQGRWADAESAVGEARAGLVKVYGEQHERYAGILLAEAELRLAQQDAGNAEPLYQRVLDGWSQSGEPVPDTYVYASLGLARVRLLQGQAAAAAALVRQVLERVLASPLAGSMLLQEAAARLWLGEALRLQGKSTEALPHLQRAVELRENMDDSASPWLAQARIALAKCLINRGDADEARRLLAKAKAALASHAEIGPQFRTPLQQAQAQLQKLDSAPHRGASNAEGTLPSIQDMRRPSARRAAAIWRFPPSIFFSVGAEVVAYVRSPYGPDHRCPEAHPSAPPATPPSFPQWPK